MGVIHIISATCLLVCVHKEGPADDSRPSQSRPESPGRKMETSGMFAASKTRIGEVRDGCCLFPSSVKRCSPPPMYTALAMGRLSTLCLAISTTLTECLDNGLARTPPMGWMTWERYRCITDCSTSGPSHCINEQLIKDMADRLAKDCVQSTHMGGPKHAA